MWLAVCVACAAALTACGTAEHPGVVAVVASTEVWASVARAVAGGHIAVRSILTGTADPHDYQARPADAAALADADLVVYNGGGYDPWVEQVLVSHRGIRAVDAYSFLNAAGAPREASDEHVFYNLNVAKAVAAAIAERLSVIDPAHSTDYLGNAAEFGRGADAIAASEHAIATAFPATGVIASEPVVHYLLAASGLINRTPVAFAVANENDDDPAPADLASVLDLIDRRQVSAVLINPQTATPAIANLQSAARRAGVPVTEVSETMPAGTDYLTWQRDTVSHLTAALRSGCSN